MFGFKESSLSSLNSNGVKEVAVPSITAVKESKFKVIRREFDLRPAGIIQMLDLRRPIYKQTAAYGHFGRNDLNLPWERLDKVEELKKYLK